MWRFRVYPDIGKSVMNEHANTNQHLEAAPRMALFLPIAYLIHLGEEWFGGILEWFPIAMGYEVSVERFLIINSTAFVIFIIGTLAAVSLPRMTWFAATSAALLGLNGVVHTLATIVFGFYSPGTVTGVLLYIPLSLLLLRSLSTRLSGGVFAASIIFGVLLHGLVYFIARIQIS